jgi:peptidoglycan/xylan/chitin deacetylase (PgdA/CDA1 family)
MCSCGLNHPAGLTRRRLVATAAASAAAALLARPALAKSFADCFDPAALAGVPAERQKRPATPADAVPQPPPAPPGPPVTGALAGIVRRVEVTSGDKPVALTFDLCQTRGVIAGYDGAIIDYLRSQAVPATLFPGGLWLATHRKRAIELMSDPLFLLGNHSWTHHDLHSATASIVQTEIGSTEAELAVVRQAARSTCGIAKTAANPVYRFFRFPYGSCAPDGAAAANAAGSVIIQWDVVSGDPDGTSAATIERNVIPRVRPGSIVVMHANGRGTHTAQALAAIVPKLRAEGYTFVRLDELMTAGRPVAATSCYIERPGDTARYDEALPSHAAAGRGPMVLTPPGSS